MSKTQEVIVAALFLTLMQERRGVMTSFDKGKLFEQKVATMIRRKVDPGAKRNNGSHANWNRRSDIFTNLPFHVEAKDHETLKPKEWFRQAEAAASYTQTPIVAFQMENDVMAMLRFDDVLNFLVEIADLKLELEDLRKPVTTATVPPVEVHINGVKLADPTIIVTKEDAEKAVKKLPKRKTTLCRAGHITDDYGYCMQVSCKYSRGYKPPKKKA